MTFIDFEKTINLKNEKISEKIKHKNIGNLFFYFDKDLSGGFLDNELTPKSTSSFDYVILAADYYARLHASRGVCPPEHLCEFACTLPTHAFVSPLLLASPSLRWTLAACCSSADFALHFDGFFLRQLLVNLK
jgi:hypothetical protein